MFLADLFEEKAGIKTLVLLPGGYHPFHPGHMSLFQAARTKYPDADIYLVSTDDTKERPFPFELKKKLATLAGVPATQFIQVKSPFVAKEVTGNYNPESTRLIFVRSDKDRDEQPRPGGSKKDGSPSYLQPYTDNMQTMNKHGYIDYLPTITFKAGPGGVSSASQIREIWPSADKKLKAQIVKDLYPAAKDHLAIIKVFDQVMNNSINESSYNQLSSRARVEYPSKPVEQAVTLYINDLIQKIQKHDQTDDEEIDKIEKKIRQMSKHDEKDDVEIDHLADVNDKEDQDIAQLQRQNSHDYDNIRSLNQRINDLKKEIENLKSKQKSVHETAGVGKIASAKEKNDPRYSMSLTQDVRPDTLKKQLAAFHLEESKKKSRILEAIADVDEMALKSYTPVGDFNKSGPFRGPDKKLIPHLKSEIKTAKFFSKTPYDFRLFFAQIPGTSKYRETGEVTPDQLKTIFPKHADQFLAGSEDDITVIFVGNLGDRAVVMTPWIMAHRIGHAIQASSRRDPKAASAWREAENHFFRTINDILVDFYKKQKTNKANAYIRQTLNQEYHVNWELQPEYNALFRAIGTQRSSRTGQIFRPYEFLYELFAQYLGTGKITLNPLPQSLAYGKKVFGKPTQFLKAQNIDQSELAQVTEVLARDMEFMFDDVLSSCVGKIFVM